MTAAELPVHNFPRTNTYQNFQVSYSFLPFNPFSFFLSAYSFSSCTLEALGYHLSAVTQVFVILFSPCTQIAEIYPNPFQFATAYYLLSFYPRRCAA